MKGCQEVAVVNGKTNGQGTTRTPAFVRRSQGDYAKLTRAMKDCFEPDS